MENNNHSESGQDAFSKALSALSAAHTSQGNAANESVDGIISWTEKPDANGLIYLTTTFTVDPAKYSSSSYQPLPKGGNAQAPATNAVVQDEAPKVVMDAGPRKKVTRENCATTLAQCKAKNPLFCRFHGPKLLETDIRKQISEYIGNGCAVSVTKDKGSKSSTTFRLTIGCPPHLKKNVEMMVHNFLTQQPGISTKQKGMMEISGSKDKDILTQEFEMDIVKADEPPKTGLAQKSLYRTQEAKNAGKVMPVVGDTPSQIEKKANGGIAPQAAEESPAEPPQESIEETPPSPEPKETPPDEPPVEEPKAPSAEEGTSPQNEEEEIPDISDDELRDFLEKGGENPWHHDLDTVRSAITTGTTWGEKLAPHNVEWYEDIINKAGADHKVSKIAAKTMAKLREQLGMGDKSAPSDSASEEETTSSPAEPHEPEPTEPQPEATPQETEPNVEEPQEQPPKAEMLQSMSLDGKNMVKILAMNALKGEPSEIAGMTAEQSRNTILRIKNAIRASGLKSLNNFIAEVTGLDNDSSDEMIALPLALSILASQGQTLLHADIAAVGGISINGEIYASKGTAIRNMCIEGRRVGMRGIIIPLACADYVSDIDGIDKYPVATLREAVDYLNGAVNLNPIAFKINPRDVVSYLKSIGYSNASADKDKVVLENGREMTWQEFGKTMIEPRFGADPKDVPLKESRSSAEPSERKSTAGTNGKSKGGVTPPEQAADIALKGMPSLEIRKAAETIKDASDTAKNESRKAEELDKKGKTLKGNGEGGVIAKSAVDLAAAEAAKKAEEAKAKAAKEAEALAKEQEESFRAAEKKSKGEAAATIEKTLTDMALSIFRQDSKSDSIEDEADSILNWMGDLAKKKGIDYTPSEEMSDAVAEIKKDAQQLEWLMGNLQKAMDATGGDFHSEDLDHIVGSLQRKASKISGAFSELNRMGMAEIARINQAADLANQKAKLMPKGSGETKGGATTSSRPTEQQFNEAAMLLANENIDTLDDAFAGLSALVDGKVQGFGAMSAEEIASEMADRYIKTLEKGGDKYKPMVDAIKSAIGKQKEAPKNDAAASPKQSSAGSSKKGDSRSRIEQVYKDWVEEEVPDWAKNLSDEEAAKYADILEKAANWDSEKDGENTALHDLDAYEEGYRQKEAAAKEEEVKAKEEAKKAAEQKQADARKDILAATKRLGMDAYKPEAELRKLLAQARGHTSGNPRMEQRVKDLEAVLADRESKKNLAPREGGKYVGDEMPNEEAKNLVAEMIIKALEG